MAEDKKTQASSDEGAKKEVSGEVELGTDALLEGLGDLPADGWSLESEDGGGDDESAEDVGEDLEVDDDDSEDDEAEPEADEAEAEAEDASESDDDDDDDSEPEAEDDEDVDDEPGDWNDEPDDESDDDDHGEPPVHHPPAITSDGEGDLEGILALFDHPDDTLHAAEKVRDASFEEWDVYTPFPVHGMDEAMGLNRSWMPYVTFMLGATGLATALFIQFGTMVFDWPIIVSGKPFAAWPSFIPITFELTVLFAGVGTAIIMFLTAGLPNLKPKIREKRLSSDRFGIWISAEDEKFDSVETRQFLETLHPLEVREIRGAS